MLIQIYPFMHKLEKMFYILSKAITHTSFISSFIIQFYEEKLKPFLIILTNSNVERIRSIFFQFRIILICNHKCLFNHFLTLTYALWNSY